MRSIGKGIFNRSARNKRKTETAGKEDTACLECHSWPGERINGGGEGEGRRKKKMRGGKKERVSTSFQTYLRSVKYTVKNIRF